MGQTLLILLGGLAGSAAIIFVQIVLSRLKYRLPGLIMPCALLLFSLITAYRMIITPEGADVVALGSIFLLINTPTFIFAAIYWAFSGERAKKRAKGKAK